MRIAFVANSQNAVLETIIVDVIPYKGIFPSYALQVLSLISLY